MAKEENKSSKQDKPTEKGKDKQWDNFNKSLDKVIGKRKGDGSNLA